MKKVVVVGILPPPVHGMATVNEFMKEELRSRNAKVEVINLSPGTLSSTMASHGRKMFRVAFGLCRYVSLAVQGKVGAVYIGLSGGKGQLYDMLFIFVARLSGTKLFIHHHSFAYVDYRSILAGLAITLAGRGATHIVLCDQMRIRIERTYGRKLTATVLSNFAFALDTWLPKGRARLRCRTIGYLSNISPQKGIIQFLELASRIRALRLDLGIIVAGPFENPDVEKSVSAKLVQIGDIEYRGAVYGKDKQTFFDDIDLIIFPSQYAHEAEPVTVIEALTVGVPVIATDRGCLPTLVSQDFGLVISTGGDFVELAVKQLRSWLEHPGDYSKASLLAAQYASCCRGSARKSLSGLCDNILKSCSIPR